MQQSSPARIPYPAPRSLLQAIPPSRLRRDTSLYTREAFGVLSQQYSFFLWGKGLHHHRVNVPAHAFKAAMDRIIGNPNHSKSIFLQKCSTLCILLAMIFLVMLRTIQFNHQTGLGAVKICNILSQHLLS